MDNKIMLAMSGGVDSAVAAHLIKKEYPRSIGVTLSMFDVSDKRFAASPSDDFEDAKAIASRLGMDHFVYECHKDFENFVISNFVSEYFKGNTPNPCVVCNKYIKFGFMLDVAKKLECSHVATGHYVRLDKSSDGRYLLWKGKDAKKDQSYMLWTLSHTLFPLGDYTKEEVKEISREIGLTRENKRESQDICFIPDGDYASFISRFTEEKFPEGNYIDVNGNVLGRHSGAVKYTVGQRKGLGISLGQPMYVCGKNMKNNTVTLGLERDLYSTSLDAKDINFIPFEKLSSPIRVEAKVRYSAKAASATLEQTSENTLHLEFDSPQRAVTSGQSVVIYDGDCLIGGGIIK